MTRYRDASTFNGAAGRGKSTGTRRQSQAEAAAAGLGGANANSKAKPIGVRVDYTKANIWMPLPGGGQIQVTDANGNPLKLPPYLRATADAYINQRGNQHIYTKGDEDQPGSLPPEQIDQLQQALVTVGLLPPGSYRSGQWEGKTVAAFTTLLGQANRAGIPWENLLDYQMGLAAQGIIGPKQQEGHKLTVQLASPDDIKFGLDQKAPDMIGRKLKPDEQDMFVKQYHDLQTQAATSAFNAQYGPDGLGGPGGTVTAEPSLESFIDQQLKDKYKGEYQANQMGVNGMYFLDMLSQRAPQVGLPGVQS